LVNFSAIGNTAAKCSNGDDAEEFLHTLIIGFSSGKTEHYLHFSNGGNLFSGRKKIQIRDELRFHFLAKRIPKN
jgi:hypothetical protein